MITLPTTYPVNPQSFVQGPTKLWYAPYVAAGADPAQNNIVALGLLDKGGVEFDHKQTFAEMEVDQSTTPFDAFLTKQEWSIKATLLEVSPANLNVALGLTAGSLVLGNPNTQSFGEQFDILSSTSNPSQRPPYRCFVFQFPSPGHDNTTTPIGAWGYLQLYKAYVATHGAVKFSKDNLASVQVTIKAVADATVLNSPYKIGKMITQ